MLLTDRIERFVKKEATGIDLFTHDFGHLKRVGVGAVWFVKVLGGKKQEQDLAYIAGLLHDIIRPSTEKVDHAQASAERSREVLKDFGVTGKTANQIVQTIRDHRREVKWTSPLHQSVYLADKILEQMGAYVAFRRCFYVGECRDYLDKPWEESIINHFRMRLEFQPKHFPKRFAKLIDYQFKWSLDFSKAFEEQEAWAVNLAGIFFQAGRDHTKTLEVAIRGFRPEFEEDEKYKKEALEYIRGKKFGEFEKLV